MITVVSELSPIRAKLLQPPLSSKFQFALYGKQEAPVVVILKPASVPLEAPEEQVEPVANVVVVPPPGCEKISDACADNAQQINTNEMILNWRIICPDASVNEDVPHHHRVTTLIRI